MSFKNIFGGPGCVEQIDCFAEQGNQVEPECNEISQGFDCESKNILGKINWLFNKITCAIKNISERISVLESENPVTGWQVYDSDGDGIYDVSVTYRDGTSTAFQIEDTDIHLDNPRSVDSDNDGKQDGVLWDVVNDDGNLVSTITAPNQEYVDTRLTNPIAVDADNDGKQDGVQWSVVDGDGNTISTFVMPLQEYIDTNSQSVVTGLSFNALNNVLSLTQQTGGTKTTTINAGKNVRVVNQGMPNASFTNPAANATLSIGSRTYNRSYTNSNVSILVSCDAYNAGSVTQAQTQGLFMQVVMEANAGSGWVVMGNPSSNSNPTVVTGWEEHHISCHGLFNELSGSGSITVNFRFRITGAGQNDTNVIAMRKGFIQFIEVEQ